jgi:spore germination protein
MLKISVRIGVLIIVAFILVITVATIFLGNHDVSKKVQVYYEYKADSSSYENIRYDLVTDIMWAFVKIDNSGNLNYDHYGDPSDLISLAHSNGVKVHLSFQEMPGQANRLINNNTARTNAVNNLLAEVKSKGFDGIDNDIESYHGNQNNMTTFVKDLYTTFKSDDPAYIVSMAVPVIDYNIYNGPIIKDYIDYITIMAYFWDDKNPISGPVEPMLQDNKTDESVIRSIYYWENVKQIPASKIVLGIPYYGFDRETYSDQRLSHVDGDVKWVYLDDIPKNYNYDRYFDSVWKTPWQVWNVDGQWHQLHYEDVESLTYKYDTVNSDNLAGISIWTINYAMTRSDLWQLIDNKFNKAMKKL